MKIKTIQARIIDQDHENLKFVIEADFGLYDWKEIKLNIPLKLFKSVYRTEPKTLKKEAKNDR